MKREENEQTRAKSDHTSGLKQRKILVAYFSHSGNTRIIANQINDNVHGDVFEIVALDSYPSDYDEVVEQARRELRGRYRPKLKTRAR